MFWWAIVDDDPDRFLNETKQEEEQRCVQSNINNQRSTIQQIKTRIGA